MNHYIETAKSYLTAHKKDITTAAPIVTVLALLIGIVLFATFHNMPNIVYKPIKACDLLTPAEAQKLLGDKINGVDKNEPKIANDLATSKCSYTDLNAEQMKIAAVAVQSGINDKGVALNKASFKAKKPDTGTEDVKGLGDSAYFNRANGQLNILRGKQWIILNYGVGNEPESNTLEDAIKLAHIVL